MAFKLYDAEIEYLGSDSHAYIITGINVNNDNVSFTGHFMYTTHINYAAVCGNFISDNHNGTRLILSERPGFMYYNLNTVCYDSTEITCKRNVKHSLSANYDQVVIDSITETVKKQNKGTVINEIVCLFNRSLTNIVIRNIGLKIYDFQIYDNGILVRYFIPVRVGTVGYMYDKVSGKLFGNAGTGEFILGPDR